MATPKAAKIGIGKYRRLASLVALLTAGVIIIGLAGCGEPSPPPAPAAPQPAPAPAPAPEPKPAPTPTLPPAPTPAPEPKPTPKPEPSPPIKYDLNVIVEPGGGGTVSPSSGTYESGQSVAVTAKPADGYEFDRWGGDASGSSNPTTIKMDMPKNVVAYFKKAIAYQTIKYEMPPGAASAYVISYHNQLQAGQKVDGIVELTGDYYSGDQFANWRFQIFGAANELLHDWSGNILSSQHHDFSFTATSAGRYTLKVSHVSRYSKNMVIKITPPGWATLGS